MSEQEELFNQMLMQIAKITDKAKTMGDLHQLLNGMAYAIGGMVCHFDKEDRSGVLIDLTQSLGFGLQNTAKSIGEPSDIEMIVGNSR